MKKIASMGLLLALAGCGGGGSNDGGGGNTPDPAAADPQGYWEGTASTGAQTYALVTEAGDIWAISANGNDGSLLRGKGSTSGNTFSGSGTEFFAGTAAAGTFTAQVDTKRTLKGRSSSGITFDLTYSPAYDTPALQSDLTGSWLGTDGQSLQSFTITSAGAVTGASSFQGTTCRYSGTAKASPKNYYNVTLQFERMTGCLYAGQSLSGIGMATKVNGADSLLIAVTTRDNNGGIIAVANK